MQTMTATYGDNEYRNCGRGEQFIRAVITIGTKCGYPGNGWITNRMWMRLKG